MAEHLASIFGTGKDRVNCPFYFKIGACRHGDRCSRLHYRPTISPTLLLSNMYQRPDMATPGLDPHGQNIDPRRVQEHFEDFYENVYEELGKYGEVESLNVCDNLADHMVGNVYVQFQEEEQAAAALQALSGRFYAGRPIIVDFSPVTDFREATCRQYEENTCNRGGYFNFMHLKKISRGLRRKLFGSYKRRSGTRSRSRSLTPRRDVARHHKDYDERSERSIGGRGYDRRYDYDDDQRYDRDGHRRSRSYTKDSPRREYSSRSRSLGGRAHRSPVRETSEERRGRIEEWNREREGNSERRAKIEHRDREVEEQYNGNSGFSIGFSDGPSEGGSLLYPSGEHNT